MNRHVQILLGAILLLSAGSVPRDADAFDVSAGAFRTTIPEEIIQGFYSIDTVLLPTSSVRTEIENIEPCDDATSCPPFAFSRKSRERARVIARQRADLAAIDRYLDSLRPETDVSAKSPVFGETENREVVLIEEGRPGQILRKSDAVLALRDALEAGFGHADLPVDTDDAPSVTDPGQLGLSALVAEGTTDFRGSTTSRIHNINRALEQFQGLLIAPGEEFSFVENLGEVDGEHGYLPELVIKYNRTEPEYGGGICQVSSTLFRAAINAGLRITERKNHAYPVSYYRPYGMDATIYIPSPDLRFVNNTPGHILIRAEIVGTKLSFRLYGTDDGREVAVDGPHILESNPDGSMKTVFSQTVTDATGETVFADEFKSSYKSPDLFPHPEDTLTEKPEDWSKKQWQEYLDSKRS